MLNNHHHRHVRQKHVGLKTKKDQSLINSFSVKQIESHIASVNNGLLPSPHIVLKENCLEVPDCLQQSHQHAWVFSTPVDPVEFNLPDSFKVIKKPLDLGTIRENLDKSVHYRLEEFEERVLLTFDNALLRMTV